MRSTLLIETRAVDPEMISSDEIALVDEGAGPATTGRMM
jgi:hypothetical protein